MSTNILETNNNSFYNIVHQVYTFKFYDLFYPLNSFSRWLKTKKALWFGQQKHWTLIYTLLISLEKWNGEIVFKFLFFAVEALHSKAYIFSDFACCVSFSLPHSFEQNKTKLKLSRSTIRWIYLFIYNFSLIYIECFSIISSIKIKTFEK